MGARPSCGHAVLPPDRLAQGTAGDADPGHLLGGCEVGKAVRVALDPPIRDRKYADRIQRDDAELPISPRPGPGRPPGGIDLHVRRVLLGRHLLLPPLLTDDSMNRPLRTEVRRRLRERHRRARRARSAPSTSGTSRRSGSAPPSAPGIFATTGTAIAGDRGPARRRARRSSSRSCSRRWPAASRRCATPSSRRWSRSPARPTPTPTPRSGEFVAWIIGWDLIVEYAVGNIGVAIGWSGYFRELLSHFGLDLPAWLATDFPLRPRRRGGDRGRRDRPGQHLPRLGHHRGAASVRLPGHRQPAGVSGRRGDHGHPGDRHQGVGELEQRDGAAQDRRSFSSSSRWAPSSSSRRTGTIRRPAASRPTASPASAPARRSSSSATSASTRSPPRRRRPRTRRKDMPFGIIMSLVICTVLYIALSVVMTGMAPWQTAGHRRSR